MGKYLDEYSKALEDIQTNGTTVVNMDYLMALNLGQIAAMLSVIADCMVEKETRAIYVNMTDEEKKDFMERWKESYGSESTL